MLPYNNVKHGEKSIYSRIAEEPGVARRGQGSEAARVPLTKAHISPFDNFAPSIRIRNEYVSSVSSENQIRYIASVSNVRVISDGKNGVYTILCDELETSIDVLNLPSAKTGYIVQPYLVYTDYVEGEPVERVENGHYHFVTSLGFSVADLDAHASPNYIPKFEGSAEIWAGASLVIVKRPPLHRLKLGADRLGRGIRGCIRGFSKASRRRMMKTIGKIRNNLIPIFVTLTYPADWPHDSSTWKRHLDIFFKRLARKFPESAALWKLEPQQRGAPHYHLLIWGASFANLLAWSAGAWFDIVGSQDEKHLNHGAKVEQIRSWRGVQSYASKYLGKLQTEDEEKEAWRYPGRWWGVYGRERIPWGEKIVADLSRGQSIRLIRTMRKFQEKHSPHFKKYSRKAGNHFDTLFMMTPDASMWFRRLDALIC